MVIAYLELYFAQFATNATACCMYCKFGEQHTANMQALKNVPEVYPFELEGAEQVPHKPHIRHRISAFADYTSMHGPAHVKRVHTTAHKLLWVLFLFSATSGLLYQIIQLVIKYRSNLFAVLVDVRFDRTIRFPAVTVCNSNAYR